MEFDMSTVLYTVTSRDTLYNGYCDQEDLRFDADCWYEGSDRKKSLKTALEASDDVIKICKHGISRNVYEWSAIEYEDEIAINCEIKIFDPLDRFKRIKELAKHAYLFSRYGYDLISYIVGERELIEEFMRNNHWLNMYRYTNTAFGDFTAYEEEGNLWLPENFCDYGILNPDELMLAMGEGVTFWQDWQTDDPEARLIYKIFQNN